jgi:hypothetical protein
VNYTIDFVEAKINCLSDDWAEDTNGTC